MKTSKKLLRNRGIHRDYRGHAQQDAQRHTPGTVAEYDLNVVKKNDCIAWHPATKGEYRFVHTDEKILHRWEETIRSGEYIDCHSWCFVPHSFRLIIHDLFYLGLSPFQEVDFFPTEGCEFFVTLGRQGKGVDLSRMQLLESIESELKAAEPEVIAVPAPPPVESHVPTELKVGRGPKPKKTIPTRVKTEVERFLGRIKRRAA